MGLFSKLFGSKEEEAPGEVIRESRETMERYLADIRKQYGESEFDGETQAKQILAVYSFGGVNALAIQHKMSHAQAHALCLALFVEVFGYTPDDSAAKAQAVITAAPDKTSHLYSIIHRGLDAFLHWQQEGGDGAAKDFGEIMDHMKQNQG
jgi:hypothetical protein